MPELAEVRDEVIRAWKMPKALKLAGLTMDDRHANGNGGCGQGTGIMHIDHLGQLKVGPKSESTQQQDDGKILFHNTLFSLMEPAIVHLVTSLVMMESDQCRVSIKS